MKTIARVTGRITMMSIAVVVGLLAISTISNALLTRAEKSQYPAPGRLVTVHGDTMHVYSKGNGEKKIVLLSGFGTACPALDFKYLVEGLSAQYTVIVVENFGYGWSDTTATPRTVANIVDETRAALKLAGFAPPYILMPHSISGIYSLYYANMYPAEVEGIVGLDTAVPAELPKLVADKAAHVSAYPPAGFMEFVRASGLGRIALQVMPEQLGVAKIDIYTAADYALFKTMLLWNYANRDAIDESNRMLDNFATVQNMKIPTTIPAAFVLADSSVEASQTAFGLDWTKIHEAQVTGNIYGKVIVLPGGHYIHYNHVAEIKLLVDDLLRTASK